jgi:hypothetical protein
MRLPRPNTTAPLPPDERDKAVESIKWAWFKANGYEPHSGQYDVHVMANSARFIAVNAGSRGGKSRCVGEEVTVPLLVAPTRVWLVGQNYNFCEKEFRYVYDRMTSQIFQDHFGSDALDKCVYDDKGGNMQIRTKWGSEIKCVSLENREGAGAFGEEVDYLVLCEPAQIKNPQRVWERVLRARLASRLGKLICAGTPSGKSSSSDPDGWFFNLVMKGLSGDDPDYYARSWASWENPSFMEDPYELRKGMNAKIFAEQFEGQFVTFSGSIFESFNQDTHVISPFRIPAHWNRYESIDPGYSGEFCWLASVVGYDGAIYIVDEYFANKTLYLDHANAIWERRMLSYGLPFVPIENVKDNKNLNLYRRLTDENRCPKITRTFFDPEDPQCLAEFAQYGIFGVVANNDVHIGIDRVEGRLKSPQPRLFITSNCTHTIDAMLNHAWGEKQNIDLRMPANDRYKHAADDVRYLCMGNLSNSENLNVAPLYTEETMDDILNELTNNYGDKHPFDYTFEDRRRVVYR